MLFGKKIKDQNALLLQENQKLLKQNADLKEQINALNEEIMRLNREFTPFVQEKIKADEYRAQLDKKTVENYNLQFAHLKAFIARWQANLPENKADNPENKKRLALTKILSEILQENTPVNNVTAGAFTLERLNDIIGGNKIDEDSTFDLNAVLNPSSEDLDLEKLCKELGVME